MEIQLISKKYHSYWLSFVRKGDDSCWTYRLQWSFILDGKEIPEMQCDINFCCLLHAVNLMSFAGTLSITKQLLTVIWATNVIHWT